MPMEVPADMTLCLVLGEGQFDDSGHAIMVLSLFSIQDMISCAFRKLGHDGSSLRMRHFFQ